MADGGWRMADGEERKLDEQVMVSARGWAQLGATLTIPDPLSAIGF
jgi:hypothetical protein